MTTVDVNIRGLFGPVTKSNDEDLILIGRVFSDDGELNVNQLREKIPCTDRLLDTSFLGSLNGFFALIFLNGFEVYVVSDKVRSRPLFYSVGPTTVVSDDFYYIAKKIDNPLINSLSEEEFLLTGYVTSSDTLVQGISQVESAQCVQLMSGGTATKHNYWYFTPERHVMRNQSVNYWFDQLDLALTRAVERLIAIAAGRQIVIPLSGGYDSRAIAIYLKRSGYSNVVTFTFGKPESHEMKMSKNIANSLGLEWHYIQYSRFTWEVLNDSYEFDRYISLIGSGVSVANVQVLPAIKELLNLGVVKDDAVVVPGHTGDFIAGGHFSLKDFSFDSSFGYVVEMIANRHYKASILEISNLLVEKISKSDVIRNAEKAGQVALAESWECRERQSKFIANSNRYYDFFGLDWWMPFWDNEFIALWESAPYELRINTNLWTNFVNAQMFMEAGENGPTGRSEPARTAWSKVRGLFNYFFDPNGLIALVPFHRWFLYRFKLSRRSGTVFGVLAERYVKNLKKDLNIG